MAIIPVARLSARLDGPLGQALRPYRGAATSIVLLSVALNVLALTGSIYLMLVYDRVLLSGSVPSLLAIFAIVIVMYLFQGAFDTQRARLLDMVGQGLDRSLAGRLQHLESDLAVRGELAALPSTPLRDLDQIRSFMAGQGVTALIDLPWIAFFLLVLWLLHPLLALTTLVGALVLGAVTWANDRQSRSGVEEANRLARQRALVGDRVRRNLGAIRGLGIASRMDALSIAAHEAFVARQSALARTLAKYLALGRGMRMFVQSAVLTVGAFLVIDHQPAEPDGTHGGATDRIVRMAAGRHRPGRSADFRNAAADPERDAKPPGAGGDGTEHRDRAAFRTGYPRHFDPGFAEPGHDHRAAGRRGGPDRVPHRGQRDPGQ